MFSVNPCPDLLWIVTFCCHIQSNSPFPRDNPVLREQCEYAECTFLVSSIVRVLSGKKSLWVNQAIFFYIFMIYYSVQ